MSDTVVSVENTISEILVNLVTDTIVAENTETQTVIINSDSQNIQDESSIKIVETVLSFIEDTVLTESVEVEIVVTSLGSQGVQGIQGIQGVQGETGATGPAGVGPTATISTASDVDISTIKTGSILIYNQSTEKWVSETVLSAQYVDSGQY
jgi:hypothetical protein